MNPPPAAIRPYRPDDYEAVVGLLAELEPWKRLGYGPSDWRRVFPDPLQGREVFVLETGGSLAGVGVLRRGFLFGDYLELLAVGESFQGKGLGSALLARLERVAFARGRNLFVCVSDFNHGARRFYARSGYTEIGPILHLLIPGSAEILLRKTTGPAKPV